MILYFRLSVVSIVNLLHSEIIFPIKLGQGNALDREEYDWFVRVFACP